MFLLLAFVIEVFEGLCQALSDSMLLLYKSFIPLFKALESALLKSSLLIDELVISKFKSSSILESNLIKGS